MKPYKFLLTALTLFLFTFTGMAQEASNQYDETYAKKLGADEYGMKKYVVAFLKAGPNRSKDKETRSKLQRAHLDNIHKMAKDGILVLAGPFFGDGELRGIYVFDVDSIEAAQKLTESDPLIQSGGLIMELREWYGSAALLEINNIHKKIQKKAI